MRLREDDKESDFDSVEEKESLRLVNPERIVPTAL